MKFRILVKNILRRIAYTIFFFQHKQKETNNIYLFSTRRGGSTWLSQLLSCDKNTRYVDHALGYLNMDFLERSYLPKVNLNQYIEPDNKINLYFESIESGKLTSRAIANPFNDDYVRKSNRLVFKITEGKALLNWIMDKRNGCFVFQFRHPISNALSIVRNNWGLTLEAYLKSNYFIDNFLTKEQHQYATKIAEGDDKMEKCVLNWTLENLVPFNFTKTQRFIFISYEETVQNSTQIMRYLAEELSLKNISGMIKKHNEPSNSSKLSTNEIREKIKNNENIIGSWRKKISKEDEKRLLAIPEFFNIRAYEVGKDMPSNEYLLIKNMV